MWKKDPLPTSTPAPSPRVEVSSRPVVRPLSTPAASERVAIGRSVIIRGEVTGDEDVIIHGRVEGSVDLKEHEVTVGATGEVRADILGRVVTVEGRVIGNLLADERVVLKSSASVEGDIKAPRVVMEDGARFRGGVYMGEQQPRGRRPDAAGAVAGGAPARIGPETKRTPDGAPAPSPGVRGVPNTAPAPR